MSREGISTEWKPTLVLAWFANVNPDSHHTLAYLWCSSPFNSCRLMRCCVCPAFLERLGRPSISDIFTMGQAAQMLCGPKRYINNPIVLQHCNVAALKKHQSAASLQRAIARLAVISHTQNFHCRHVYPHKSRDTSVVCIKDPVGHGKNSTDTVLGAEHLHQSNAYTPEPNSLNKCPRKHTAAVLLAITSLACSGTLLN